MEKNGSERRRAERCVIIMPCRYFTDVMYREDTEEKDGAYLKLYDGTARRGNGSGSVLAIQNGISERTGQEKTTQRKKAS